MNVTVGTALGVLFAAAIQPPAGVAQSIAVDEPILVSAGIDHPLMEPHLIVDPKDPDHLLAAAIAALAPQARGSRTTGPTFCSVPRRRAVKDA